MAALPTAQCLQTASALQQALAAMAGLVQTIDAHFEHDAPSLAAFTAVLQGMHDWIAAELRRRGVAMPLAVEDEADDGDEGEDSGVGAAAAAAAATAAAPSAEAAHAEPASTLAAKAAGAAPQGRALAQPQPQAQAQPQAQPVSARAQAYAQLASAAQTLREIDPHSPVPYLVQRAIAWGQLNTAQLYRELFVDGGGQISIFELLGVEVPQEAS